MAGSESASTSPERVWRRPPTFDTKMRPIVGLYVNPPSDGPVVCADECTRIAGLDIESIRTLSDRRWRTQSGSGLCEPYAASAWITSCRSASDMSDRCWPSSWPTTTKIDPIDHSVWRLPCPAIVRSMVRWSPGLSSDCTTSTNEPPDPSRLCRPTPDTEHTDQGPLRGENARNLAVPPDEPICFARGGKPSVGFNERTREDGDIAPRQPTSRTIAPYPGAADSSPPSPMPPQALTCAPLLHPSPLRATEEPLMPANFCARLGERRAEPAQRTVKVAIADLDAATVAVIVSVHVAYSADWVSSFHTDTCTWRLRCNADTFIGPDPPCRLVTSTPPRWSLCRQAASNGLRRLAPRATRRPIVSQAVGRQKSTRGQAVRSKMWCRPPRTGREITSPATGRRRDTGVSKPSDRWGRSWL